MEYILAIVGVVLGALAGWFMGKNNANAKLAETQQEKNNVDSRAQTLQSQVNDRENNLVELKTERQQLADSLRQESSRLASVETKNQELERRVAEFDAKTKEQAQQMLQQFENLSNKILDENSKKFSSQNKDQMGELLNPLRERIVEFQKRVEENNVAGEKRTSALSQQLINLQELNKQITEEAKNLTTALRGDSKTQGNWGEMQLEKILQKSGLEKGTHYRKEENFKNDEGQNQRLDYIIDLPDGKHLIIDSKVSLTAYTNFHQAEDEAQAERFKKLHLDSVYAHMKTLSAKNYQDLYGINTPDYVLMFVANEPALTLALREDPDLYEKALNQNLVLVSTTTLMATMRTISYIWRQDAQNRNADEIARQAGALYDKFVGFTDDMLKLGGQMSTTTKTYTDAMKKLTEGTGNLIRRTEKLKEMGANTSKGLNSKLLDRAD
jgi:DNA recombination protein RmuC